MTLSANDILNADDIQTEVVDVPEWGGKVLVRGMTAAQADAYERRLVKLDKQGKTQLGSLTNITAFYVVQCIVGEDGKRLFTDSDAAALGTKSGAALARVYRVARRLSGGTEDEVEAEAEAFDEAQDGDSSTE